MSFVPAPQQASAAANNSSNINSNNAASALSINAGSTPDATPDQELVFKIRTFDVYWVEKKALMYKDGIAKVSIYSL